MVGKIRGVMKADDFDKITVAVKKASTSVEDMNNMMEALAQTQAAAPQLMRPLIDILNETDKSSAKAKASVELLQSQLNLLAMQQEIDFHHLKHFEDSCLNLMESN